MVIKWRESIVEGPISNKVTPEINCCWQTLEVKQER